MRRVLFLFIILSFFIGPSGAFSQVRVALLPFQVHSREPLDFLKEGIVDMLSSRLGREGQIVVVDKGLLKGVIPPGKAPEVTADLLNRIGRGTGAEYVVSGSLTKLGNIISMDATIYKVPISQPLSAVFLQGEGLESLIIKIGELARELAKEITTPRAPEEVVQTPPVKPPRLPASPPEGPAPSPPSRPEEKKLPSEAEARIAALEERLRALESAPKEARAPHPGFIVAPKIDKSGGSYWQSRELPFQIEGIDVGDLDGDGKSELVVIDERSVRVYRNEKGNLAQFIHMEGGKEHQYIHVDLIDIDGDGKAEVFISNATKGGVPSSLALRLKDGKLQMMAKDLPWYLKAFNIPGKGRVLLGQGPGVLGFYSPDVYEMAWKGGRLVEGKKVEIPYGVSIYDLAIGEFKNKGRPQFLALDKEERLILYSTKGDAEWRSGVQFGGTVKFVERDRGVEYGQVLDIYATAVNRFWIEPRMVVRPSGADGLSEAVVVKNISLGGGFLSRGKLYTEAEIYGVGWNGISLGEVWRTPKIDAYIADVQIGDFDNDGKEELIVALVLESKGLIKKGKSALISYRLS